MSYQISRKKQFESMTRKSILAPRTKPITSWIKPKSWQEQGMLFSIVPSFGNTWFLLCLERLDADWLSHCVCLGGLHSDCFCCMWYCYHTFSLDECHFLYSRWQDFLLCLHSDWLSGLEKKDASMFEMVSNSFVISEINLYQSYLKASI